MGGLYTVAEAAAEIATLAASRNVSIDRLLEEINETIDDRETQRISRDRLRMDTEPLQDVADRFGVAAESERSFPPWLQSADKARAASRALQDLGDDEL